MIIMISEYQLNVFFSPRHTRYLSPLRPGLRVLPPESSAPPSSQAPSQPAPQPASQAPRLPKSNSLSLFYKKCKISTVDLHFHVCATLLSGVTVMFICSFLKMPISRLQSKICLFITLLSKQNCVCPLQCTAWPTPDWRCCAPTCCPPTQSWSPSSGPCSSTRCSTSTSWWGSATWIR